MINIKSFIVYLLLLASLGLTAQVELNQYLHTAAENNPELKARFNEYMAALEVVPQVKALPDPVVAFGYFISPVETRVGPQQFKISASQMFPWFGSLSSKKDVAAEAAKAKYELFEEAKSKLFSEVKAEYFNLWFNNRAVSITLENIDLLNSFQQLATIKVEAGLVSMVDEYRIEMEMNELENQLALLRDNQFVLETSFNNLLNVDNNELIIIPDSLWTTGIGFTRQAILDSMNVLNHRLLSLDFQSASLQYRQKVANKQGLPNISIGVDYINVGKGENNLSGKDAFMFPRVGISIPLYRKQYKSKIQEVVYQLEATNQRKVSTANALETLFENYWRDYNDAERRIGLFTTQLLLARKSLNILETEYATGNMNFEEILRMERKVLKFELEKEKATTDKQAAIAYLRYLMGKE